MVSPYLYRYMTVTAHATDMSNISKATYNDNNEYGQAYIVYQDKTRQLNNRDAWYLSVNLFSRNIVEITAKINHVCLKNM